MTWLEEQPYSWRQGYKTYKGASLRERRSAPLNPYDQDTQPRNYQHWLNGWKYAEDEHGLSRRAQ